MLDLEVVYENSDYLIVNKLAGLISENNPFEKSTVEQQVLTHLIKNKPKPFIGIIHRLDRVTSGLLIFAKKKSILVEFNLLFSSRKIQKTYLAVVKNKPPSGNQNLTDFLQKNNIEKKSYILPSKTSSTVNCALSYKVIGKNNYGYLLEIKPRTGRFHQIRAQLANKGLAIIGDEKYGSDQVYLPLSICLHAWKITYQLKDSLLTQTFEAPMPNNLYWKFEAI